jgi:2-keto-3-deoxy-L-rhamnonate aldolase RhmA
MVPMISTPEEAQKLVHWSKYMPLGDRGYATGVAHLNFKSAAKHVEVMEEQNKWVVSIAQIETETAVNNAEVIASLDGIDVLLIGPNDLSLSLGIPGDLMNPIELDAISHVIGACKKYHKAFGLHAGVRMLKKFKDDLTMFMCDTDIGVLEKGFLDIRESLINL